MAERCKNGSLSLTIGTDSPEQTQRVGAVLGGLLGGGEVIGLRGELGSGKTEFVRGVCAGMQLADEVSSPSYVLEHIYDRAIGSSKHAANRSNLALHHWDLYRLGSGFDPNEIIELAHSSAKVIIIEWPEQVGWVLD